MAKNIIYTEKKYAEMDEKRNVLLALSGKIRFTKEEDIKTILRMYQVIVEGFEQHERLELMYKSMREDWLVDISIEDNLLKVVDIAETNDWIKETAEKKIKRAREAFGWYDENDIKSVMSYYTGIDYSWLK